MNTKDNKEILNFEPNPILSVSKKYTPASFPAHWHNALEFTAVFKDGCKYIVNGVSYQLDAGDVLLVWPRQLHEIINVPHSGSLFIQFRSSILENNLDLISITRFLNEFHHISAKEHPELAKYVFNKILEIRKLNSGNDYFAETKSKRLIYDILLKVGEFVMSERQEEFADGGFNSSTWRYINAACNFITENSTDSISQADVAKQVGLSSYYFSKLFKQYMQMSFPAYLARIRVRNAITLLLDDSLTITECAFQAGFQSTTAFNKVFHEITGYAPREYRKMHSAL
ncbi:MAG: helix-turn-helix domain-containing protein [Pseudobutyrivibrio sp.]|nr:helix-turn-helix domain-containing protein [Pseudobutyrivibrio sp.]